MLILIAIILGFLIGKIRRGSLQGFKVRKISLLPVGILGFILQAALHFYMYTGGISLIDPYLEIVNFASYILILVMLVFNLDDFWVILMAIGITSNFVVIFINGGHMPVNQTVIDILPAAFGEQITQGLNPLYSLIQPNTLLWFLGVNIPFAIPFVPLVMSLYGSVAGITAGSIVALIGLIGFIQYVMNKKGSIIHDDRMEHMDDEGIFGDEEQRAIGNVSIQDSYQEGYDEPEDIEDLYRDMAVSGGIRGERQESDTIMLPEEGYATQERTAIADSFETQIIPAALEDVASEIGTETEEIIISKSDISRADQEETRVIHDQDDGSTKVLSNIQEVGTYVKGREERELEAADMEEILNSDDAGFFTKKYYEEKLAVEKERMLLQMREMELNKVAQALSDPNAEPHPVPDSDLRIVESFKLTELDQPFVLRSEKNNVEAPAKGKDDDEIEFSEDEMMNVWQRLNQEDEKRKAQRRKQLIKEISHEAELLKKTGPKDDRGVSLKEIEEVTEPVVGRVYESTREEKKQVLANMNDEEKKVFQETVEERKRAGYELVELKLDGKDVAFWKKKK